MKCIRKTSLKVCTKTLQGSEQLQTVSAMYKQELNRDQVAPSCQKLRKNGEDNALTRRQGHAMSRPGMKELRREYSSRVKKGEMSAGKEKWENAFGERQLDMFEKGFLFFKTRVSF